MHLSTAIQPALAYLDPGAGSMILQLLLGGSAAILVVLKFTWRRLLARIGLVHSAVSANKEAVSRP